MVQDPFPHDDIFSLGYLEGVETDISSEHHGGGVLFERSQVAIPLGKGQGRGHQGVA